MSRLNVSHPNARVLRFLAWSGCGFCIGLIEANLLPFIPNALRFFHPALPLMIFLLFSRRTEQAFAFTLSGGIAMDLFVVGNTTFATARAIITLLAIQFLGRTVLTNHSFYALIALIGIGRMLNLLILVFVMRTALSIHPWLTLIGDVALGSLLFLFHARIRKWFFTTPSPPYA